MVNRIEQYMGDNNSIRDSDLHKILDDWEEEEKHYPGRDRLANIVGEFYMDLALDAMMENKNLDEYVGEYIYHLYIASGFYALCENKDKLRQCEDELKELGYSINSLFKIFRKRRCEFLDYARYFLKELYETYPLQLQNGDENDAIFLCYERRDGKDNTFK